MGVLNLSPESFTGDGLPTPSQRERDKKQLENFTNSVDKIYKGFNSKNISIVDVGAQSTSPHSTPIRKEDELERFKYYLNNTNMNNFLRFPHSIDSYRFEVVEQYIDFVLDNGLDSQVIVNDVSGAKNKDMINLIKKYNLGIIVCHRHPDSVRLHEKFGYQNPTEEVKSHLSNQVKYLIGKGVEASSIAIDPALGFGKEQKDSYSILDNIEKLHFGYPIVVGFSKKKFSLNFDMTNVELTEYVFSKGVSIVRTHIEMQE